MEEGPPKFHVLTCRGANIRRNRYHQRIKRLHVMCSHNKNPIVAWGCSRGGRWLEELAREKGHYLDVAIIIGGYPESKGRWQQEAVATELIKVKKPIVCMVHYASDEHCSALHYPYWHAVFERMLKYFEQRPMRER